MMIGNQTISLRQLIDAAPHIVISEMKYAAHPQPGARVYKDSLVQLHN